MSPVHPDANSPSNTPCAKAFREGVQTGLPALFGIGAWGIVLGVAMVKSGLTVAQACGMTLVVYAGSAQLASLPLIAAGAPIWVIFATALVVNLRFVIFSALLAPHFAYLPMRQRLFPRLYLRRFDHRALLAALSKRDGPSRANCLS